ncbi:protein-disulfide reductase DsbD domain-containing protein [Psychromarinibacter halotolerans]|uniref:Protein-disulfide reductase DsbD domain-containing protein n=1 Tax=Psychromarinibacter halotolerans TaxID=1775175 RepID=A0ABV7GKJ5_9RHOB|nr:protein-disulfide reductase DsbD domain-containing protein [Psychromarinibacter halotolerans]MDF0595430.1 protein-disulfide reductase DsbD family protein [Psychromarinibacter halotolerans]
MTHKLATMLKKLCTYALLSMAAVGSGAVVPTPAVAQAVSPDQAANVTVLPGWRTPSGTRMTALRIQLSPGWKTYWRAPGDAGIPPRFDWQGSSNLRTVAFHWPTPSVFDVNGMRTIGYKNELILPIELTPERPDQPIVLNAAVQLGVCHDVCLPLNVTVSADLADAGQSDPRINAALAAQPFSETEGSVTSARCAVEPIRDGLRITATVAMPSLGPGEVAVFEHPDQTIWVAEAEAHRNGDALTAVTEMVPPNAKPFSLDRSKLRITVLGNGRAVDIWGCTG